MNMQELMDKPSGFAYYDGLLDEVFVLESRTVIISHYLIETYTNNRYVFLDFVDSF